jgi:hypothetical protein
VFAAVPAALLVAAAAVAADYEPGQVWAVKGRLQDPDPQVLILWVEPRSPVGDVVFVAVGGVKLCLPGGKCGDMFSPLAMSKDALDKSVTRLVGPAPPPADTDRERFQFEKGYEFWKQGVARGAPVTVTVPVAEALDEIEGGAKIQIQK